MARQTARPGKADPDTESTAPESTEPAVEDTAAEVSEATDAEAPAADTADESAAPSTGEPAPAAPTGPTAEEVDGMLTAFALQASTVVAAANPATAELPEEGIATVRAAYAALPGTAAKNKARNALEEEMKTALSKHMDVIKARAYMLLTDAVKATAVRREAVARPVVDPSTEHINRVAAHMLAPYLVPVGPNVAEDWAQKANELARSVQGELGVYQAWIAAKAAWDANTADDKGEAPAEPDVHDVVKAALRIASGRAPGRQRAAGGSATPRASVAGGSTYSGPRRDVKEHIRQAFADQPVGTFLKIKDIVNFNSTAYGDDHPSGGAVTASLKSAKFDVAGVQRDSDANGKEGARKVA